MSDTPLPPGISPAPAQAVQDAIDGGETRTVMLRGIAIEAGADVAHATAIVAWALGETPDYATYGGPSVGETDVPEFILQEIAEQVTQQREDGSFPDPMAVVAQMGNQYGLTPEQVQEANSLLLPYTQQIQEATREGPLTPEQEAALPTPEDVVASAQAEASAQARGETTASGVTPQTDPVAQAQDEVRQTAIDWLAEHLSPEQVATGAWPDLPDDLIPAGLSGQTLDSWLAGVQEDAKTAAQDEASEAYRAANPGASDEEVAQVVGAQFDQFGLATDVPIWMLQQFGGGATWNDPALRQRVVDYWNDNHGTNFTDFSQVVPYLERMGPTTEAQEFVQSAMAEQEPLISHSIRIPFVNGAQSLTYTEGEMATLREMGFSNDAITRLVRLNALQVGVDGLKPGPSGGNTADIYSMAALLRYYGGGAEFGTQNQGQQDLAQIEIQLGLKPGEFRSMTIEERRAMRAELVRKQRNAQASPGREGAPTPYDAQIAAIDRAESALQGAGRAEEHGATPGILASRNNLNRGLATYNGDPILAFISSIDPALAQRIAASGGDPQKLNGNDNAAAMGILDRGGITSRGKTFWEQLGGSGGNVASSVFSQLTYFDYQGGGGGGGGGGGAGPVRRMIDPVSIKEQLSAKFADLMLPDIPDAVVSSVQDMLQAQLDASPEGMNFDVSARIMDWIHGRPEYGELYGRKPQGMTEAEYQSQFQAGVQDILGAQADPEAVKAGLRGNDYQAAVGTAAIGGLVGRNSRLMGRWALAKQTLDKFS